MAMAAMPVASQSDSTREEHYCDPVIEAYQDWVHALKQYGDAKKSKRKAKLKKERDITNSHWNAIKTMYGADCGDVIFALQSPKGTDAQALFEEYKARHTKGWKAKLGFKARFTGYGDDSRWYSSATRQNGDYISASQGDLNSYYDNINGDYYYDVDYDDGYKGSAAKLIGYDDADYYYNNGAQFGGYYGSNGRQRRYHRNRYGRRGLMDHMNDDGDIFGASNGMELDSVLLLKMMAFIGFIALIIIFAVLYRYKMRKYKTNDKYQQIEAQINNERETSNTITQFPI